MLRHCIKLSDNHALFSMLEEHRVAPRCPNCWIKRPAYLMKQFSLLEIISTATVLLAMVVESSGVFHIVGWATLQATHRCTPAPYGTLAVLPTHSFRDMDHLVIQIFALYVRCRLVLQ